MAAIGKPNTPPVVSGGKPAVGHALEFLKDPVAFLERGYRENGSMYMAKLGNRDTVIALGPENNKFFFTKTDKLLSLREGYPFFLKMFSKNFYFFAPFEEYLKQRELIMPKFKGEPMRGYVKIMADETQELIDQLGDEGEFDLIPTLGPLVMNVAAHAFLGSDFRGKLDDGFFDDFRDFSGGMEPILPLWLPLKHLRKSQKAKKKLHKILREWIQYRKQNPMDPPDFFQNLIGASLSDGTPVDEDLAISMILLLVWAGHETTAGQVSWAMIDLLQHPDYLNEVRTQTAKVMNGREVVDMTWEDARDFIDVELAIKESERLHPVAYVLMRKALEDIELGGYTIPKDTAILAAPSISHRMPEVFKNPHAYHPRRFDPGTGEGTAENNCLIGFGGGVHRCAGVNFARLEMKIVLTMLCHHYDLELIDMPKPISGTMTYWPAQPCRVRYAKRTHAVAEKASAEVRAQPVESLEPAATGAGGGCPFHSA